MTYECIGEYAVKPYYIEGICLNVFSLEELMYYLKGNAYLLDATLPDVGLVRFIEEELKLPELAEELKRIIRRCSGAADFVLAIMAYGSYLNEEEMKELREIIEGNEDSRGEVRKKTRGDFFFINGRYAAAVEEYQEALEEAGEGDADFRAELYGKLGSAYAKAFLFADAARCFEEEIALRKTRDAELKYLLALKCSTDRMSYQDGVLQMHPEPDVVEEAERLYEKAVSEAEEKLKELRRLRASDHAAFARQADAVIRSFKDGYRRK
ncbi:MAG: hypothetical protein K6F35_01755 [Lachnospiraceae bacterium]|nr:hypothetical protein [Lachnospiraceae bacterium]